MPDNPFHIAAFKGAIYELAKAYSWGNDDAHTAKDVAAVWLDIFNNLGPCEMVSIRLKPTDFCMVQLSTDGGSTWADVADLSACAHAAAVDEIQDAIDRGDLSGGGQQPGQGSGTPGVCYEYDLILNGNNRWHCPVALEGNDFVTVSADQGAWWDGDVLNAWQCPDGTEFLLGGCTGSPFTDSGDPAPTVGHMRLIGNFPNDTTTPYFDMHATAYEIPTGQVEGEFFLQANDSALADNQGSISLHVQVCKSLWTHTFDFTIADGGWAIFATYGAAGSYVAAQGWTSGCFFNPGDAYYEQIPIYIDFSSRKVIRVTMTYTTTGSGGYAVPNLDQLANQTGLIASQAAGNGVDRVLDWVGDAAMTRLIAYAVASEQAVSSGSGCLAGQSIITKIVVRGTGTDPF